MTTRQARHKRGREHNGGGIAPRAALLFNLGHRIEAVQFTRVAPAVLCLEYRRTEDKVDDSHVIWLWLSLKCCYSLELSLRSLCYHHNSRRKCQQEPKLHLQMDKTLDAQFLRVEKALATLVASISTYNPNPVLAHDLVAADQELSHGLADCMICSISLLKPPNLTSLQ